MRYGMNPHQTAEVVADAGAVSVVSGEPSLINYLDALNGWQLVNEASGATGLPVAASFKHVSPAGVATNGDLDESARETWGVPPGVDELTSAYVRARDADPKSSFGDVVAVSHAVTGDLAEFVTGTISDAMIAPGYEAGTVATLSRKRGGRFLLFEVDPDVTVPVRERRDIYGMTFEQDRDITRIDARLLAGADDRLGGEVGDALLALIALRYTQSNAIAVVKDGMALGIGAGQQNRVDCVRLAVGKARLWWLRRHPYVRQLASRVEGMKRQDRLKWQIRFAEQAMTGPQRAEFAHLFGAEATQAFDDPTWRDSWAAQLTGLTMASDGFLPLRDNIDYAAAGGVTTVVEPGGSIRTPEVHAAARELGVRHLTTAQRLFHH
jgi:phosphoribosylaminoimidazolecarboxamide formyltransferase/IMP cyclohydrolase